MASKTPTYGKDLPGNLGTEGVLRAIYDKIDDGQSSGRIEEKLNTIISLAGNVNNNIQINTEAVKENTQAIKDISINVDVHSEDLQNIANTIDRQTQAIKDISINVDVHSEDLQNITNAIDRQTQAIKDISINIDNKGICDKIDNVNQSINNLDNDVKNGFNRTIDAIKEYKPQPRPVPPCPPHPHPHPHPVPPKPKYKYPNCYNRTNLSTDYYAHYYGQNQSLFQHNLDVDGPQPVPTEALYVVNNVCNDMIYDFNDSF